jgi:hypothetical protein
MKEKKKNRKKNYFLSKNEHKTSIKVEEGMRRRMASFVKD